MYKYSSVAREHSIHQQLALPFRWVNLSTTIYFYVIYVYAFPYNNEKCWACLLQKCPKCIIFSVSPSENSTLQIQVSLKAMDAWLDLLAIRNVIPECCRQKSSNYKFQFSSQHPLPVTNECWCSYPGDIFANHTANWHICPILLSPSNKSCLAHFPQQ